MLDVAAYGMRRGMYFGRVCRCMCDWDGLKVVVVSLFLLAGDLAPRTAVSFRGSRVTKMFGES